MTNTSKHQEQNKRCQKGKDVPVRSNGQSKKVVSDIYVVPPEKEDGNTEYKRLLHNPNSSRLRTLTTQMCYRLDQGHGTCRYIVGVEDNGKLSMLQYSSVFLTSQIIKCVAKSLNARVSETKFFQNEISSCGSKKNADVDKVVYILEENDEEKLKKIEKYAPTRCEMTIQRIETHSIASAPRSLSQLSKAINEIQYSFLEDDDVGTTNGNVAVESQVKEGKNATKATISPKKMDPPLVEEKKSQEFDEYHDEEKTGVEETLSSRNVRVAVVGNVDAGKSTLIGTLTTSSLDDGRGKCRTSIMKHRHEIESGRTSTVTSHLLGFQSSGERIAGRDTIRGNTRKSEDAIARESDRIITLMDLAGHEKYFKSTIHGVSSGMADYALILVNSRHPPTHMTQHHLHLCCSFGIPVIVVFTKIDNCPEHAFQHSRKEVIKLLRAPDVHKQPFQIKEVNDITTCIGKLQFLAPLVDISCVTGEGLDLLSQLLFTLPRRRKHESKLNRNFEFLVEDIFNVPGVGSVTSGFVNAGDFTITANSTNNQVFVGPLDDGKFMKTFVKSAHIARIPTSHVTAGQNACLALSLNKEARKHLRRGMVILKDVTPSATREFDAEICVLKGEGTTIRRSYQAYVHILNVRQSAFARQIELVNSKTSTAANGSAKPLVSSYNHAASMEDDEETGDSTIVLRPGCRAKVRFEFAKRPEYIRPGMRMLFRDGRVRGVGIITGIPTVQPISG